MAGSTITPMGLAVVGTIAAMTDFWTHRRVLVTGGSGFLGRAVVARLKASGADQIVVPRSADTDLTVPPPLNCSPPSVRTW